MPQDNLTIQFKKELDRRGVSSSLSTIEDILRDRGIDPEGTAAPSAPAAGGDLWESLRTGEGLPDWIEGDFGYETSLSAMLGKSAWSFIETAGFGVPGFIARGIDEEFFPGGRDWEEIVAPKTTAERWATAITGVAGFMPPFTVARSVAALALKGARVTKAGKVVGYGAEAAGKKFADNTVRILKNDKEFLKWAASRGMGPDDIERFVRESDFMSAGVQSITKMGSKRGARLFSSHSVRTQYAKQLEENIPKIINSKIDEIAAVTKPTAAMLKQGIKPFAMRDKARDLIADEVKKYVGGKYNMPITSLHQLLALKFGNRKIASIGASAAEEAILFTAVELPMNFFNSLNNEDVDFAPFQTAMHSIALGSALGLVRLIPGGSDTGILRTGFKRMNQYLSRRRRWDKYNVNNAEDRMLLVKHAGHLFDSKDDIFNLLAKREAGARNLIRDKDQLADFAKSATEAVKLKKWMAGLENAFMRQWWPDFMRQSGRDILESSKRMIAGSLAFNVGTVGAYMRDELPLEDLVFHTLLGAVLSKKGRDIEYTNEHGDLALIPGTRKPLYYENSFEKVNQYLDLLGMNINHSAFRNMMNNLEVIKKYGSPDLANDDIIKLIDIGKESGLFVGTGEEPKLKNETIDRNPLYESIKTILNASIEDPEAQRVKNIEELSTKEIVSLMKRLRTTNFKSLAEYRTIKSTQKGIATQFDVYDILLSSSKPKTKEALGVFESAVREAYNIILEMEHVAKGGRPEDAPIVGINEATQKMELRPLSFDVSAMGVNTDRVGNLFGRGNGEGKNSALGLLKKRVTVSGPPIVFTGEMNIKLFGARDTDSRGEMDRFDRQYTKTLLGELAVGDDVLIQVGEKTFNDVLRRHLFTESLVTTHNELALIRDKDGKSLFGDQVTDVQGVLSKIYGTERTYLPGTIAVIGADGKRLKVDSDQQKFATNLLSILLSDTKYSAKRVDLERQLGIEGAPRKAKESDVDKLITYFESKGLMEGFKGDEADVSTFVKRLTDYTFEKSLGNATRTDGTPLGNMDFAVLQILQQGRLAGRGYDMVDLRPQVDSLKRILIKSDILDKADSDSVQKDVTFWVTKNSDKVDKVFDELSKSTDKDDMAMYKLFSEVAESARETGSSEKTIAYIIGDYLTLYEKTLKNLWSDGRGNGILKASKYSAVPSQDFMYKLLAQFEAIQSGAIQGSYDKALETAYSIYDSTKSASIKEFMTNVFNSLLDKKANTTRLLEVWKKFKLFNDQDGTWLMEENVKTLDQRMKDASEDMRLLTQPVTTDRSIEMMFERDKIDFQPKHDSDLTTSTTFTKLMSDWGIVLPEIGDTKPQDYVLKAVYGDTQKFEFNDFFKFMTSNMIVKEIDGKTYSGSNWADMPHENKQKIASDMHRVWLGLKQTREVRSLKIAQGANPESKPETIRRNDVSDVLEDLFNEVVFIDLDYRLQNKRLYNVSTVSDSLLGKFLMDTANVGQLSEARQSRDELIPNDMVMQSGYMVAFIGDLKYGIGIPIKPQYQGEILQGQDKLANRFVERLKGVEKRFPDSDTDSAEARGTNRKIRRAAKDLLDKYVENDKTRIVKRFELEDGTEKYTFRRPTAEDIRASDEASLMLSLIVGDTKLGGVFWESVINSKMITKGYSSEKELAHDFFRRIRLLANGSTLKLEVESIKSIVEFYDRHFTRDELGNDYDALRNVLEPITKSGMTTAHIIRDEAEPTNPKATSAYKNLASQVLKEEGAQDKDYKIIKPDIVDGKMQYPGGLGDTSHMNSVIIVSKEFMRALKMLTGDFWRTEAVANKPVISFADDVNAAFLGKTMFVVDSNFEPYFKANDINMVIFESAVKGMGRDYRDRVIDLDKQGIGSIEELIYSNVGEKKARVMDKTLYEIGLPIESIGIQMWNDSDKPARIPLHVGADLLGKDLNNTYFDWLMKKSVNDYQRKASEVAGGSTINRMIAHSRMLFGDIGADLDNQMYSTIGRMLEYNMYPMFLPWRRTMKNAIMRHYIQKAGVFSPPNEFGSQSAVVPSYFAHDHPLGLRNTLFYGENRDIYTYGEAEVGKNNYEKGIGSNVTVLLHHPNKPDEMLSWREYIKNTRQSLVEIKRAKRLSSKDRDFINMFEGQVENFVFDNKRATMIGQVHDFLEKFNTDYAEKGVKAQIAIVDHRTPSLKSSDKVIVGIKGFNQDGNLARLNTVDFWTRLEGDHDFDKLNYWWDTPTKLLKEWSNNSGNIMSVTNTSIPTTIEGLSFDDASSIRKYNFNSTRAEKMRGPVVKARRLAQWMGHYQGKDTGVPGYNIVVGPQREFRVSVNQKRLDDLDEKMATDAQRIIDSKDGWTEEDFSDRYFEDLLFGNESWDFDGKPWKGVFQVHKKDLRTGDWGLADDTVAPIWKDAVMQSIKPYQAFLQLATDVYEGGEATKVDYDTLLEGYQTYRDSMKSLNRVVLKRLSKVYEPEQLRDVFGKNLKKPNDIFGLQDAFFPAPADRTKINHVGNARSLLPFDRAVWAIASVDRLFVERPRRSNRLSEDEFDNIWEKYVDQDNMTSKVLEDVVGLIRREAKSMAMLNAIGSKIRRTRSSIERMDKKQRFYPDSANKEIADMFRERLVKLESVRAGVQERMLSDPKVGATIKKSIKRQMITNLLKGDPVLMRRLETIAGKTSLGAWEEVQLKGKSENQRRQWISKNSRRIDLNLWQNKQLVPQVRGIDSNEYAQLAMWHQTMVEFTGIGLDPKEFEFAEQFELDIFDARKEVGDTWRKWGFGKEYQPNEREDVVQADLMRMMESRYAFWEGKQNGLGLMWLFRFMTPVPDMQTVGYFQGKWVPGFRSIDKEIKYMNLGLNFLNTTKQLPDNVLVKAYAKKASFPAKHFSQISDRRGEIFRQIAETFTDKMRVLYGEVPVKSVERMSAEESLRQGSSENRKDIFDFQMSSDRAELDWNTEIDQVFKQVEQGDLDNIANLNDSIKQYYGITGIDISLDYLSMRGAPTGYDTLYDIRQLADFYFRPSKVLNSRGKMRSVKDLKSYYGFVKRNASVFFGEASEKDMLVGKDVPHIDINPYGGKVSVDESTASLEQTHSQIWRDMVTTLNC